MAEPIPSKVWSTSTLDDGIIHVTMDLELAKLQEEEDRIQMELQADGMLASSP